METILYVFTYFFNHKMAVYQKNTESVKHKF